MRAAAIGLACGAALLQTRAQLPEPAAVAVLGSAAAVLLLLLLLWSARAGWRYFPVMARTGIVAVAVRVSLIWFVAIIGGFLWAAWLAHGALAPSLAPEDEGRDFIVVGTIDNLPYRFAEGARFNFAVERVEDRTGKALLPMPVPPRIAISWYSGSRPPKSAPGKVPKPGKKAQAGEGGEGGKVGEVGEIGNVQPGERWRLTVRLQRPHGNANPHGFDYEAWLLEQGVRATGYVRADRANGRRDAYVASANNLIERSRAGLRARIEQALDGRQYAGVIVALVVGDQRGIGQSDWQVFNRTGIGHLVSISGLHITMVAGLFAWVAFTLWRHSFFTGAQLPLLLPAQKVAALVGAVSALLYVLLAGFGVPAQRTLYMLIVVAVALWCNRLSDFSHVLCTALGVVVVIDPWAVLWPGFWLSFGAVAVIVYATAGRTTARPVRTRTGTEQSGWERTDMDHSSLDQPPGTPATRMLVWLRQWWPALKLGAHTQYAVTLGLLPLTMLLFSQVSLISPVANAVAIPLISLVITPLALAGSMLPTVLGTPLLVLAHWLVEWLAACLAWFSGLRYAVWTAPAPPWWLFCSAMFGTLWLLAPRGWPVRWLGLATWIPLLAAQSTHPAPGRMTVTAFDVGQGMALLVETSSHRLLYDTGPTYGPDSNAGGRVLVPYLRARGIARLDGVVVSHSDVDHAGGALTVLDNVRADWVLSSLAPGHPIARAARQHVSCAAGQQWTWDGVLFEVLHPLAASRSDAAIKSNARSCVLRITASGKSVLLAGDIEAAQEARLVQQEGGRLRADVLLAPHHGSGTSSTPAFLQAVLPQAAIFQVGHRNRYGHPKKEVYQRYGDLGIERLRTDRTGALTIEVGPSIEIRRFRYTDARYWHDQP